MRRPLSNKIEHERDINLLKQEHLAVIEKCAAEAGNQRLVIEKHKKHVAKLLKQVGELQARVATAEKVEPPVVRERDQALAAVKALKVELEKAENSRRNAQEDQKLATEVNKELAAEAVTTEKVLDDWRLRAMNAEAALQPSQELSKQPV